MRSLNNKHTLESGIWEPLVWVPLAPGVLPDCNQPWFLFNQLDPCSHLKVWLRENLFPSSPACWQGQFLTDCWPRASLSSLPHGSLYRVAHNMVAGFPQNEQDSERKPPYGSCSLFIKEDVMSHLLHQTLLAKSESLNPAHIQEKGLYKRHEFQEVGITGYHLISWLAHDDIKHLPFLLETTWVL